MSCSKLKLTTVHNNCPLRVLPAGRSWPVAKDQKVGSSYGEKTILIVRSTKKLSMYSKRKKLKCSF